jgi:hypothetical protein
VLEDGDDVIAAPIYGQTDLIIRVRTGEKGFWRVPNNLSGERLEDESKGYEQKNEVMSRKRRGHDQKLWSDDEVV